MGSFWFLVTNYLWLRAKFKFYPWCLARNSLWISKSNILKKTKKLAIFKLLPLPFGSMYFKSWIYTKETFDQWSFLVISNKSARICLNIFGDTVVQSLKSRKTRKVASFPFRDRKNLWIYSWYSLPDLKHHQKRFIRIPSFNFPEMRPLGTFWSILSNGYLGNDDRYKNLDFSFGYVFKSSVTHYHQIAGEKVIKDQNFQIFCFRPP